MFNKLFQRKYAIDHHNNAPLLNERLAFLQYLFENGSTKKTLQRVAQYLLIIIDYLNLEYKEFVTVSEVAKAAEKWSKQPYKYANKKHSNSKNAKSCFLVYASHWLEMIGRLKHPKIETTIFSNQLNEYLNYLRQEKGLSDETIKSCNQNLSNMFEQISKNSILSKFGMSTIDKILMKKSKIDRCSRRTVRNLASIMRTFLIYAEGKGWCQKGLALSIEVPRVYKFEKLPLSPTRDDVKKLLASTEGDHPTNIRDRAILLLLIIYGIRTSEVIKLRVDDFDWINDCLHLRRSKNSKSQIFPLLSTVGNAVQRYLKDVRPNQCLHREVFISRRAPYRPLTRSSVFQLVSRRWMPLSVTHNHKGPHSLRFACATHLINEGITLKVISDYLGHNNVDTTRIYTKIDLNNLRKIADFDIGELL